MWRPGSRAVSEAGTLLARVGGDEFLLFLEHKGHVEAAVQRIYNALQGQYEDFEISISMGVARAEDVGSDYDALFRAADQALYAVKRSGRGQYRFYNKDMEQVLSASAISAIDDSGDEENEGAGTAPGNIGGMGMTLQECYSALGGSYDEVISRPAE